MSFSQQRGQIQGALIAAGVNAVAAARLANILGNSQASTYSAGREVRDTTPAGMRFVTKNTRKSALPHFDFRGDDPDYRPFRKEDAEQRRSVEPPPNVVASVAPQQTDATYRVASGTFTQSAGRGDSVSVGIKASIAGRPREGLPMALMDGPANAIVGKGMRAAGDGNNGRVNFYAQETGDEMLLNMQLANLEAYNVVTKVEFVDRGRAGSGINVTYQPVVAWPAGKPVEKPIPAQPTTVVTGIVEDNSGLRGERVIIPSFSQKPATPTFFNTYRIGTYEGAWPLGGTKQVTQIWPTGGGEDTIEVINKCAQVAWDASTDTQPRHVLFASRFKDSVTDQDTGASAPQDLPEPTVEHYAIEIENSSKCEAFASLAAKYTKDLPGWDATKKQALIHDENDGCMRWRSVRVAKVVSDLAVDANGLSWKERYVTVLDEYQGATEQAFAAISATAVESISLSGGQLVATRKTLKVLGSASASPSAVDTTSCSTGG
jgi:hypothetical protein